MQNINYVGQPTPIPNDCDAQIIHPVTSAPSSGSISGSSSLHNSLDGIQGGTINERYHLTKLQHDSIANQLTAVVDLVSNQSIGGSKTFLLSPQVPNGQTGNDAVNYSQLTNLIKPTWYFGPWTNSLVVNQDNVVSVADNLYISQVNGASGNPVSVGFVNSAYKLLTDTVMAFNITPSLTNNTVYQVFQVPLTTLPTTTVSFTLRNDGTSTTAYQANYYFVFENDIHQTLVNTWHELKPVTQSSSTFIYKGGTFAVKVEVLYSTGNYIFRVRIVQSVAPTSGTTLPLVLEARKSGYNAQYNSFPQSVAANQVVDANTIPVLTGIITQVGNNLFDDAGVQFFKGTPTTYTFTNGLSVVGSNVKLGGALLADTTISPTAFNLFIDQSSSTNIIGFKQAGTLVAAVGASGEFLGGGVGNLASLLNSNIRTTSTGTLITRDIGDSHTNLTVTSTNYQANGLLVNLQNYYRSSWLIGTDGDIQHFPTVASYGGHGYASTMSGHIKATANSDLLIGMEVKPTFGTSTISTTGSLVGGSGYPNGTQYSTFTGGTGINAVAQVTVTGGAVTSYVLVDTGLNYTVGDVLSFLIEDSTGTPVGTGGHITVTAVNTYTGVTQYAMRTYGLDVYDQDYSTSYTPRTKVDKHYVDNAISVATGSPTGVLSVSVVSANGISGTSSGGTTPALTLSLSDITPTSVSITGTGLSVNQSSGDIATFKTGGVTQATVSTDGYFRGSGAYSFSGLAGGFLSFGTGTTIGRNLADANAALKVQQTHLSATGDVVEFQNAVRTAWKVAYDTSINHSSAVAASSGSATASMISGFLKPTANNDILTALRIAPNFGASTIATVNTLVGGSSYPNGTWLSLVVSGSGTGAVLQVTVSGGVVTGVTVIDGGANYLVGDVLNIVSTTGTGASVTVATITSYTGVTNYALTIGSGAVSLAPATTTTPTLIVPAGASYGGTQDGSIWYDGTHLYAYIAGAPRQIDRQTVSSTGISSISIATANGVSGTSSGGATPTLTFTLRTQVREVPSGLLNGSNVTFSLLYTPLTGQELLFLNGVLLNSGDDYTISGATITMLVVPGSTDKLLACYPY